MSINRNGLISCINRHYDFIKLSLDGLLEVESDVTSLSDNEEDKEDIADDFDEIIGSLKSAQEDLLNFISDYTN